MAQDTEDTKNQENEEAQPEPDGAELLKGTDLPSEMVDLFDSLPQPAREKLMAIIAMKSFRGPIPPPEILKGYNDIIPNGAERILLMAEEQSQHRMGLEKKTITEEQRQSSKGQNFGFALGITGILATVFMAYSGHDTVAGIFGTTTIVGLAGVFVYGRHVQAKEMSEKQ